MPTSLTPTPIADDVFELEVASAREAQSLAAAIRDLGYAEDVVAGLDRVSIKIHPSDVERVAGALKELDPADETASKLTPPIEIEITYGGIHGPDLEAVCQAINLSVEAFINAHTRCLHTVEMIGFTPGFSYISGLSDEHRVPRLSTPRPRVPAGSVGLSAGFTGIYALDGPGGWPLIGKTEAELFSANREAPFLLTPGQRVKFKAR